MLLLEFQDDLYNFRWHSYNTLNHLKLIRNKIVFTSFCHPFCNTLNHLKWIRNKIVFTSFLSSFLLGFVKSKKIWSNNNKTQHEMLNFEIYYDLYLIMQTMLSTILWLCTYLKTCIETIYSRSIFSLAPVKM
jgi:hypothetical protein